MTDKRKWSGVIIVVGAFLLLVQQMSTVSRFQLKAENRKHSIDFSQEVENTLNHEGNGSGPSAINVGEPRTEQLKGAVSNKNASIIDGDKVLTGKTDSTDARAQPTEADTSPNDTIVTLPATSISISTGGTASITAAAGSPPNTTTAPPPPPLFIGVGRGTTATDMFSAATCAINLPGVKGKDICNVPRQKVETIRRPHYRLVQHRLFACLSAGKEDDNTNNNCQNQNVLGWKDELKQAIDDLVDRHDVTVVHDTPYPFLMSYLMEAATERRGVAPILLLAERNPQEWAKDQYQINQNSSVPSTPLFVCRDYYLEDIATNTTSDGGEDKTDAFDVIACMERAEKSSNKNNKTTTLQFDKVFTTINSMNETDALSTLTRAMTDYQDLYRPSATYAVDVSSLHINNGRTKRIREEDVVSGIRNSVKKSINMAKSTEERLKLQGFVAFWPKPWERHAPVRNPTCHTASAVMGKVRPTTTFSQKYKVAMIHIPKSASSTIRASFQKAFDDATFKQGYFPPDDYYRLVFLRDPFERFLSGYEESMLRIIGDRNQGVEKVKPPPPVEKSLGAHRFYDLYWKDQSAKPMEAFEDFVLNYHDPFRPMNLHLGLQTAFLLPELRIDFYGHVDNVTADWNRVLEHFNVTEKQPPKDHDNNTTLYAARARPEKHLVPENISDVIRAKICEHVKIDMECLGLTSRWCP